MTNLNQTYERIQTRLSMWDGRDVKSIEVTSYAAGRGLTVHKITDIYGNVENAWTITHLSSGRRVCGPFKTRQMALEVARRLQCIRGVNWSKPMEDHLNPHTTATWGPKGLGRRVRKIIDEVTGSRSALRRA